MDLHGFTDIRQFRVRIAQRLSANQNWNQAIEVCHADDVPDPASHWLDIDGLTDIFPSQIANINPLNLPGPIYGADTDTCATGPAEAPDNVLLDNNGQEFVFRQAANATEFRNLVAAGRNECFLGYGADGNLHWQLSLIRQWWRNRDDMLAELGQRWRKEIAEHHCQLASVERWRQGLLGGARGYLQVYGFFVENGRVPTAADLLPDVD